MGIPGTGRRVWDTHTDTRTGEVIEFFMFSFSYFRRSIDDHALRGELFSVLFSRNVFSGSIKVSTVEQTLDAGCWSLNRNQIRLTLTVLFFHPTTCLNWKTIFNNRYSSFSLQYLRPMSQDRFRIRRDVTRRSTDVSCRRNIFRRRIEMCIRWVRCLIQLRILFW